MNYVLENNHMYNMYHKIQDGPLHTTEIYVIRQDNHFVEIYAYINGATKKLIKHKSTINSLSDLGYCDEEKLQKFLLKNNK